MLSISEHLSIFREHENEHRPTDLGMVLPRKRIKLLLPQLLKVVKDIPISPFPCPFNQNVQWEPSSVYFTLPN